ncbi:unnamed protein product [Brachionus calyciflorus]|uniref:Uncharacterized protein n=1 Tax=Brachionus calyciflorus TaxID=104777 RepID=A0A814RBP3_9BILA|nr:unnamed protein product [Brachionus calyciflorus]
MDCMNEPNSHFQNVFLQNGDLVDETDSIECTFSDNNFVLANLTIKKQSSQRKQIPCRYLSSENLLKIYQILSILDQIAPLRTITINLSNQLPRYDEDLIIVKQSRDCDYKRFKRSNSTIDKEIFEFFKKQFKQLNDEKLIKFFQDKTINDFKNARKFWKFFSPLIKVKSDKSTNDTISSIKFNNNSIDNKSEICNIFNSFFTSMSSTSKATFDESAAFINESFKNVESTFEFSVTNGNEINELLSEISDTSGAGLCGIPIKCRKNCSNKFKPIIAYLFNFSIISGIIPNDWETAVVTLLYKNKGSTEDLSNYCGISVLPPIAKLFEKLLHKHELVELDLMLNESNMHLK